MLFIPWKPKVLCMYVCTPISGHTSYNGGLTPPFEHININVVSVVSGFGTRRTTPVVSVPSGSDWNQFRFLRVLIRTRLRNQQDRAPILESKPCNQAVARTTTLCCRLPNRATKLLPESQPFVAGFQTVQPSSC